MKYILSAFVLIFVGAAGWRIGGQLNSESLGMAVGILFGVMAGIPTALILLASQRSDDDRPQPPRRPQIAVEPVQPVKPPTQIVNNFHKHLHFHGATGEVQQHASRLIGGPNPEVPAPRNFRIVGEHEEIDW